MGDISPYQAAVLLSWFSLSFTLVVMMLIGRFYARFSGKRTDWPYLVFPIILYALGTVREARIGTTDDVLANVLFAMAGASVLFWVVRLYRWMMKNPPQSITPMQPVAFVTIPVFGAALMGLLGAVGVGVVLWALGRFSQRMHHVLQGRTYFYGYYIATALVGLATVLRLWAVFNPDWALAYALTFAAGTCLGAMMSWRAWSWLLAERE